MDSAKPRNMQKKAAQFSTMTQPGAQEADEVKDKYTKVMKAVVVTKLSQSDGVPTSASEVESPMTPTMQSMIDDVACTGCANTD